MPIHPHDYTVSVRGGLRIDPHSGAIAPNIAPTTTFLQSSPGTPKGTYEYSRADNPTREQLEAALAALEGAPHALTFASGLAATQAILQLCKPGQHILVCDDVYGGTRRFFQNICHPYQSLHFTFVDMRDLSLIEEAFRKQRIDMVWVETPTNPTLRIIDLAAVGALCHKEKALFIVDNTFASPLFQKPLEFGAHLILHSTTKYISGHSDVTGGAVMSSSEELFTRLKFYQMAIGAVPSPFDCYLLLRSLQTLAVRMERHNQNAQLIAQFLSQHPRVSRVLFPGLPSHPQHALAKKQMKGFSGMISLYLKGSFDDIKDFCSRTRLFLLAESLGSTKSLLNHPATMTHASVPENVRHELGITPVLIRLSVGLEDAQDLKEDLSQALA